MGGPLGTHALGMPGRWSCARSGAVADSATGRSRSGSTTRLGAHRRALAERTAAAFIDSSHNVPLIDRAHDVRALPDVLRYVPTGDLAAEAAQTPCHYGAVAAMTR